MAEFYNNVTWDSLGNVHEEIIDTLDAAIMPMTAPEIASWVMLALPGLRMATVMRVLTDMVELGLVLTTTLHPHCVVYFRSVEKWIEILNEHGIKR